MPKIEVPGLSPPKRRSKRPPEPAAEPVEAPEVEPRAEGVPLAPGELDPVLAEAVASQPELPPEPAPEPEPAPAKRPAPKPKPAPMPRPGRPRPLAVLAAGALAVLGVAAALITKGAQDGRAGNPSPAATAPRPGPDPADPFGWGS